MSTYTAIVGDVRSIGSRMFSTSGAQPSPGGGALRLSPQVASARIRQIVAPHILKTSVGGLISADFTIPPEEAQLWRPLLKYGVVVWLFDGATPIFMGYNEKPTWNLDGSCLMNVSGPWALWSRERMREVWELWDMSLLAKGTGGNENKAGSANLNSDGSLTLSIPAGTLLGADRCSVDYLLYGETSGPFDDKLITAFEFDISDSQNLAVNRRVRVIGKSNAVGATGDQLYDTASTGSSGRQGAQNLNGTNQGGAVWPAVGYRCLRFEIVNTAGTTTIAADWYATFDRIRVSTRESLFPAAGLAVDTASIARDAIKAMVLITAAEQLPIEFWLSNAAPTVADASTMKYNYGLDPTTGTGSAPNSGIGVTGFNSLEWQAPTDILSQLASVDACHIGFYLPYNGRGGYDPPGALGADVGSWWLSPPPQLFYQAFPDPVYAPDYTVHVRDGAVVEPNPDQQPLLDQAYVNYNTLKGRQLSEVQVDADTRNYLYAQGYRRAEDWTLQPSVGNVTQAQNLGQQMMNTRRQPYTGAVVTITNDGSTRQPIRRLGATVPKLATVRPGSVRIDGVPSGAGLNAGYATMVEWWGQTLDQPETLQLTLGQPGEPPKKMSVGHLVNRIHKSRWSKFGGGVH